jgi:Nucleotidyl transferase AbiEii toxin, Type IV TA system
MAEADRSDPPTGLTPFQIEVARLFFDLPASAGFLLAGGAALVAQQLTDRPTRDLDFFTRTGGARVPDARDQLEATVTSRGWQVRRVHDQDTFCRLMISGPEDLIVDLALDAPPGVPPRASFLGPTFDPEELAGRKLLALFDRAEARDFADVYVFVRRYGKELLLGRAAEVDAGFDRAILGSMLATLGRFADDEIPAPPGEVRALRAFFEEWAAEL